VLIYNVKTTTNDIFHARKFYFREMGVNKISVSSSRRTFQRSSDFLASRINNLARIETLLDYTGRLLFAHRAHILGKRKEKHKPNYLSIHRNYHHEF